MEKRVFGTLPSGNEIIEYTLRTESAEAGIITLGATVTHLTVSGINVILGFERLEDYLADRSRQGTIIGRYANRIKNGHFSLNGTEYTLVKNSGNNHIHGGTIGFDSRIWTVESASDTELTLSLDSYDGEEGYPGNLHVTLVYRLCGSSLSIDYTATSDADTVCNLTNHSYFNLNGCGNGDVKGHRMLLFAQRYSKVDAELIPTGEHPEVTGTPLDFLTVHTIGERLGEEFAGYDHNYILTPSEHRTVCGYELPIVAVAEGDRLRMTVLTDQPCIQLYTPRGFSAGGPNFRGGYEKLPFAGFCLEAQLEPDSPNNGVFLRAGETYRHTTVYSLTERT